jgi:hypothetical protein
MANERGRPVKIDLTQPQIDLILELFSVVEANEWGAGDYQGWDEQRFAMMKRIEAKLLRKDK